MMNNPSENSKPIYSIDDLGRLIKEKRKRDGLTLAESAGRSGVSKATISRLERRFTHGENQDMTPDTRTITAFAEWLEIPAQHFFGAELRLSHEVVSQEMSLPDAVEAHLRADRKLDADAAEKLGIMFRLAYEQFAKSSSAPPSD